MVKKLENFIKKSYLLLIFIFLYTPILALIIFSFNDSKTMGKWSTLRWYADLFQNERILQALFFTVVIAIISSVIATIIGTLAAIGINKMKGPKKALLLNINYLPVLNPDIVTGIALMSLFIFIRPLTKLDFGFTTMLLAHITFNIPYVILAVLPKLRQLPENIEDAALDLGATPAWPGVTNLSIEIFAMARRGIKPEINALSTLMFVTVLTLLLIANRKEFLSRGDKIEKA